MRGVIIKTLFVRIRCYRRSGLLLLSRTMRVLKCSGCGVGTGSVSCWMRCTGVPGWFNGTGDVRIACVSFIVGLLRFRLFSGG